MQPLISLVTGTHNRLASLRAMVTTFRSCMLTGIEWEIIIVDAGSTDGTPEWCKSQPDISFIQQGKRLGAIAAFDAGAYAANGQYVLLANDDVLFIPGSVLPAIIHLETHPTCGAVAFADDRLAPGYETHEFKVQTIQMLRDNQMVSVPYPQVGLVRKWLGDMVGWWGSKDTEFNFHTYGGDSRLGAEIWKQGFSVDAVKGCEIHDEVVSDDLRDTNYAVEQKIGSAFYRKYPTPPLAAKVPSVAVLDTERLRILYLPIYEPHFGRYKWGLLEALSRVGLCVELDYVNEDYNIPNIASHFQPHLILTQVHAPNGIAASVITAMRTKCPNAVLMNWNGDVYTHGLTTPEMLEYLRLFDIQLTVNDSAALTLRQHGIQAAYWQIGYEPLDESRIPPAVKHDVVFLANGYSEKRTKLGNILQNMAGVNVGLYGRGWRYAYGDTTYKFYEGAAIYRNAKIAVGDNQYADQRGFVSNRIFEALANGVFLLHQRIDGLEELTGLVDGVHYVTWTDDNDLQKKIHYWLQSRRDAQRQKIAAEGQRFVREHHSFDSRVKQLLDEILPTLEQTDGKVV